MIPRRTFTAARRSGHAVCVHMPDGAVIGRVRSVGFRSVVLEDWDGDQLTIDRWRTHRICVGLTITSGFEQVKTQRAEQRRAAAQAEAARLAEAAADRERRDDDIAALLQGRSHG